MIRALKFVLSFGLAAALAFPPGLLLTYAIVYKVWVGDQLGGEVVNRSIVLPPSQILRTLGVQDFGIIAVAAGRLVLSLPYCLMVIGLYALFRKWFRRERRP
jgi:hypothetical protein